MVKRDGRGADETDSHGLVATISAYKLASVTSAYNHY